MKTLFLPYFVGFCVVNKQVTKIKLLFNIISIYLYIEKGNGKPLELLKGGKIMKKYTAIYRKVRGGSLWHMVQTDYNTKKDFEDDLRGNGFIPVAILTDSQIKKIKNFDLDMNTKFKNLDFEYVMQCL